MYHKLRVNEVISSNSRISSIDIFRSVAIISVVLFHFNNLFPFGYLGVDLFFVISGFLIGGILIKKFDDNQPINYFKFILQRGFKIWPSYYTFIFVGTLLVYIFYNSIDLNQIIPVWDFKRYLFFYQNYTGLPNHWSFDHVWSLCVEEHFYILLPLLFIVVQRFFKHKKFLFTFLLIIIVFGVLFKLISQTYTSSKDTYSGTHNRIDALAWGVLLNYVIFYYNEYFKKIKRQYIFALIGLFLFVLGLWLKLYANSTFYDKIIYHSLMPFCFFLFILGLYSYDFTKFKVLRIMAYYSYNWYLWHPIFALFIIHYIGYNLLGLILYLISSFIFAILFTILIEETVLLKRGKILDIIFKKTKSLN